MHESLSVKYRRQNSFAIYLLAVIMVLVQTIYIQDILGDKTENLPEDKLQKNFDGDILPTALVHRNQTYQASF